MKTWKLLLALPILFCLCFAGSIQQYQAQIIKMKKASGASITYIAAESNSGVDLTTLVVDVPAGVSNGDVLIGTVGTEDGASITEPNGWTLIKDSGDATDTKTAAYYRVASSEPSDYTWTFDNQDGVVVQLAYSGVNTGSVIDGTATNAVNSLIAPAVTTTAANSLLIYVATNRISDFDGNPVGMTVRVENVAGGERREQVCDETIASSGSTGTRTSSVGAENGPSCVMFALTD